MKTNRIWRKIYHSGPMTVGLLLLAATLMLCSFPSRVRAEGPVSAASNEAIAPCKGLKPYSNLDELLYQFYINLESDCLFTMPAGELEKIWDVKILDEERRKPKNYYPLSEIEFYNKPYRSERDAFYIELVRKKSGGDSFHSYNTDSFYINLTKEGEEKFGDFFPEKKLPMVLPEPNLPSYSGRPPCIFPELVVEGEKPPDLPGFDAKDLILGKAHCTHPIWASDDFAVRITIINPRKIKISNNQNLRKKKRADSGQKYEEPKNGVETTVSSVDLKTAPCRGLKPFNNLNELLYQFYINLDSDCLFKIPVDELEKIWQVGIITDGSPHLNMVENSANDFFIAVPGLSKEASIHFSILPTNKYYNKHGVVFSGETFPRLLPEPLVRYGRGGPFFHWLNSDWTHIIYINNFHNGVFSIEISSELWPFIENGKYSKNLGGKSGNTILNSERSEQ